MEKSFPPADALISHLKGIDYIKWLNIYMDFVESACIIIAAIAVVFWQKCTNWYKESGRDLMMAAYSKFLQFADKVSEFAHSVVEFITLRKWELWHGEINVGPLCVGYNLQNRWDDLEVIYIGWSNFFTYWSRMHGFVTFKSLEIG